jgi:deoxyribodipyrimidine photo-lyase
MPRAPALRLSTANAAPVNPAGAYVLYWMTSARRTASSWALDHALTRSVELNKPLLVLEALRCDYRWASDRLHAFVLAGMRDNAAAFARARVAYHPYVEPSVGAGEGLLAALAADACLVVGDEFPCFFLPRMHAAAAARLPVRLELVDGNGVTPMRSHERTFTTANSFRRHLFKTATPFLDAALARLPIDHAVAPCGDGGSVAAGDLLKTLASQHIRHYDEDRNSPERSVTSGLSPHLHFGHIGPHAILNVLAARAPRKRPLKAPAKGERATFWGVRPDAEGFADQLVTWRELGYNMCFHRPDDYDQYDSLPAWARNTLAAHAGDRRDPQYDLDRLTVGDTHDPLWNAAQRQLVESGTIHNYLRMLWGKKILEWSPSPQAALAAMIELNNRYALDGRDPNSYSGIFWVLGRYDRAWGPERPIFGKIRYMSSDNTARKVRVRDYIARHAA